MALLADCRAPVGLDVLRKMERKADLIARGLDGVHICYALLCTRSSFTAQIEQQAAQRDELFLFELSRIAGG